jgi:hypothetical protein
MKFRAEYQYYMKDTKTRVEVTRTFEAEGLADAQRAADGAFALLGLPLSDLKSAAVRPITPRTPATAA